MVSWPSTSIQWHLLLSHLWVSRYVEPLKSSMRLSSIQASDRFIHPKFRLIQVLPYYINRTQQQKHHCDACANTIICAFANSYTHTLPTHSTHAANVVRPHIYWSRANPSRPRWQYIIGTDYDENPKPQCSACVGRRPNEGIVAEMGRQSGREKREREQSTKKYVY